MDDKIKITKPEAAFAVKTFANRLKEMGFVCLTNAGERSLSNTDKLKKLYNEMDKCRRCKLGETKKNLVFGEGNPNAELVFVGEAPGENEDLQGIPFCGAAGNLLTKIIEAMDFKRSDVYICNVLKCRPPENRDPLPDEIDKCEEFLIRQLEIIKPRVIVGLGKYASQTLLKTSASITNLHGKWHTYHGIKFMPTFHPANLLYNPSQKKFVWDDMQKVMALFGKKPKGK